MNETDRETVFKAFQTVSFLRLDLQRLVESNNVLLADVALDLVEQASKLEHRFERLNVAMRWKEVSE